MAVAIFCVDAVENEYNELPTAFGHNTNKQHRRRNNAHLPKFSQKEERKGKGIVTPATIHNEGYDEDYDIGKGKGGGSYYYAKYAKSAKKDSKKQKSEKKDDKKSKKDAKDKKGHYNKPTSKPVLRPTKKPSVHPPIQVPSSSNDWDSQSEDMLPSTGSSEDCPPARPPTLIPPTPNIVTAAPTPTDGNENNAYRSIKLQLYAIDYTLSQTDRTPIKLDFLELQTVTASYFKDYMIKAYEVSTQATLVDFTTVFVTAHFTPGYPVHVQYNSTAYFSADSINIPTSKTLSIVLEKSLDDPQLYINELKDQLSEVNPFSTTTNAIITDPEDTPVTRSSTSQATRSIIGIASAAATFTLTLFVAILLCRRRNPTDDNSFNKKIEGDATVSGETFVSETQHSSIQGSSLSTCSSKSSIFSLKSSSANRTTQTRDNYSTVRSTAVERPRKIDTRRRQSRQTKMLKDLHEISTVYEKRPRTVEEIEKLLTIGDGDII